jgi:excisionase family DNA binding protein
MNTLLTIGETADQLRVSPSMIRKLIKEGGLPHLAIGTRRLVRAADLEEWIVEHVKTGGPK